MVARVQMVNGRVEKKKTPLETCPQEEIWFRKSWMWAGLLSADQKSRTQVLGRHCFSIAMWQKRLLEVLWSCLSPSSPAMPEGKPQHNHGSCSCACHMCPQLCHHSFRPSYSYKWPDMQIWGHAKAIKQMLNVAEVKNSIRQKPK